MSFNKYYNIFDMYGYSPHLFIGGYSKNGSLFGMITTLLSFLFIISITIYYFFRFIYSNELTTLSSIRTYSNKEDTIYLGNNSFYFAFALEDPINFTYYIDESVYFPKVHYRLGIRNEEGIFKYNITLLDVDRCNLNDFGKDYQNLFNITNYNNMYCIKNLNHQLSGSYSDDTYSFITLKLYPCTNSSTSKCKPQEEIDKLLKGTFFAFEYQSFNFDPTDYKRPTKPVIVDYITTITNTYLQEVYIYLKKFLIKTDIGLVFENIKKKNYTRFDYSNNLLNFKTTSKYFLQINFRMSTNVEEVLRQYTKVQTIFGYIGGFITFLENFFIFINYFFLKDIVHQKILDKLFFYSNNAKLKKNSNNKNFSKENININHSYSKINNYNINNTDDLKLNKFSSNKNGYQILNIKKLINPINIYNMNKIKNNINNEKNNKYKINYIQKLFSFCYENINVKLYIKGINIIHKKLDIITIIIESFQLNLIKQILFKKEHILLLDYYLKTDLITYYYDYNTNIDKEDKCLPINNEILKSYEKICEKNFQSLDDDINNINNSREKVLDKLFIDLVNFQNE